jgi:hypothetical protein
VGEAWLEQQLSGLKEDVRCALRGAGAVSERIDAILTGLLDQILALELSIIQGPNAVKRANVKLKGLADALYILYYETRGEPVQPGDPLIFTNGRRSNGRR